MAKLSSDVRGVYSIAAGRINMTFDYSDDMPILSNGIRNNKQSYLLQFKEGAESFKWIGLTFPYNHEDFKTLRKPFKVEYSFNFKWVNKVPIKSPTGYRGVRIFGRFDDTNGTGFDIFDRPDFRENCLNDWCQYSFKVNVDYCLNPPNGCPNNVLMIVFDSIEEKVEMLVNDMKASFCWE